MKKDELINQIRMIEHNLHNQLHMNSVQEFMLKELMKRHNIDTKELMKIQQKFLMREIKD